MTIKERLKDFGKYQVGYGKWSTIPKFFYGSFGGKELRDAASLVTLLIFDNVEFNRIVETVKHIRNEEWTHAYIVPTVLGLDLMEGIKYGSIKMINYKRKTKGLLAKVEGTSRQNAPKQSI